MLDNLLAALNDPITSSIITLLLFAALAFVLGKRGLGCSLVGCAGTIGLLALAVVAVFGFLVVAVLGTCGVHGHP